MLPMLLQTLFRRKFLIFLHKSILIFSALPVGKDYEREKNIKRNSSFKLFTIRKPEKISTQSKHEDDFLDSF